MTALPSATWSHVRSAENPADLATRGISPTQLQSSIWLQGPAWLQLPRDQWPKTISSDFQTNLEKRKSNTINVFNEQVATELVEWCQRFSSIDRIIRILSYIRRWRLNSALPVTERTLNWLTADELAGGRIISLRLVQYEHFSHEIKNLQSNNSISPTSCIERLAPFIDTNGFIRVGGHLQNSYLNEEEKHPVILPSKHHITKLLIEKAHVLTLHGGPTLVQSYLARRYWIVRGRNTIRGIVRKCVRCTRFKAVTLEQQMGPLPAFRTRPTRPFTITGVDFAGPFFIRCSPGRGQKSYKGYVSIFVCMVTRAVHLEIVSDLTTSAFLAAFRRFASRRGLCHTIWSDNGSNFRGAEVELQRLFHQTSAMSQEVAAAIAKDGVKWSFIPPRAPNFGGLWEATVRSFKNHFRRVVGDTKLTYEEFSTVACSIEACLNSRPLSQMSSSEEDVAALTPGHFLIGSPLISPAEPFEKTNENITSANRWQLLTLMRNHFWKRWQREFLSQLQARSKWYKPNRSFQVGDVVLFKDELTPPTKWPLARIAHLYQGSDGLSRVAVLKVGECLFKRPINKLILLPINEEASAHLVLCRELMAGGNITTT